MEEPMDIDISFYDSPIQYLPCEILCRILSFLDQDLVNAGHVCKLWAELAYQEFFERGMFSMEVLQDNFQAATDFSNAIRVNPLNPISHFKRGVAHYKENEEALALRNIDKSLSLNPNDVDRHVIKSMKCQIMTDFPGAVEEATKAIAMDPSCGAAYYLRGYNRFDLQDYHGSIDDLSHCLSLLYPYKSKVLNCRGWCYKITGEVEKALADFTLSSHLNVRYTKPFVNKAITLSSQKDRPKSLEEEQLLTEYLSSHALEPHLGSIYYTRAALKQQWENYKGAIEDYQISIEHGYHSGHKAYVSVGWCYEKLQQFDKAIESYNTAVKLKPSYSIAIEHRAGAKCRTDSKAAEEDCRLAIKTNPKSLSFAYRYLAAVMADNNDYLGAIRMLSDGVRANPLDTDMLLNRAGYFTCQGDFSLAVSDYDVCLKHRPDTYEAWKYRGNVKYASGNLAGAIQDYTGALQIDPNDCGIINNCAISYLGLGNFDKAAAMLTRGTSIPDSPGVMRDNLRLVEFVKERGHLPRQFDPHVITDPVFEKDLEKKMREVTKNGLANLFKPAENAQFSLKHKVLQSFRRTNKG
jgi:tetratricopeptide (TPR) repeat protein